MMTFNPYISIIVLKAGVLMKEKEKILFFDTSSLFETEGIRERCNLPFVAKELKKRIPGENFEVLSVSINESGRYSKKGNFADKLIGFVKPITGLPAYCEVVIRNKTGKFFETIYVWSPLKWNDRFAGTAGGGTGTGGLTYFNAPKNTNRGWSVPHAVINGFTAATGDGENVHYTDDRMVNKETHEINWDLYENWRARTTHHMTVFGKAVAEILHQRPVRFSYMNGGSGGGRQCIAEAQEFPGDYDGIWASCPAINWTKFLPCGLWASAVMNSAGHVLTPEKHRTFIEAAQNTVGGRDAYFKYSGMVDFDPHELVGRDGITQKDADVMQAIWDGPKRTSGERLWYWFRKGATPWQVAIPVGAFYYSAFSHKPKPFLLATMYARWIVQDNKAKFDDITISELEKLYDKSEELFSSGSIDDPDLRPFAECGGKLIVDHGLDDPLIPVDGSIEYYNRVCACCGGNEKVKSFFRLYINPGDGHGSCDWNGPGITETDGMAALMNWVEHGIAPEKIRTVRIDKKSGETLCESETSPY